MLDRFLYRHMQSAERRFLGRLNREWPAFHNLSRPSLSRRHQVLERNHLVDQAPSMGFLGAERLGGEHHAHRDLERDMAWQAMDAARTRHQTDARLREAQARMLGGDDDVAGERDFASAAQREAVYGGDDRLGDIESRRDAGE